MKAYGKVETQPPSIFASTHREDESSASRPGRFVLGEMAPVHIE
jgi:hypothetical protein